MPIAEKIRAAVVERMQEGEKVGANPPQPVMKLLAVKVITQNIEFARKFEPEISALLEKRDARIAKARKDLAWLRPRLSRRLPRSAVRFLRRC